MIDLGQGFRDWSIADARKIMMSSARAPLPGSLINSLGRMGALEVRLAATSHDIKQAQRLRYKVFYEEMNAVPDFMSRLKRRDIDIFDSQCDHLLVIDHDHKHPLVVGTYRLLRQDVVKNYDGFYTAREFDIGPMLAAHPTNRFLELGRSCVLKPYRDKRTVELLWHGIWAYVRQHRIDVMFGCASLTGTNPNDLMLPLSFLYHTARSEGAYSVSPVDGRGCAMNLLPPNELDHRRALQALPPLIKGYLRLGAKFGAGAVIDHQFGTTDVLVILPVADINPRYIDYYGEDASRYAA